MTQRPDVHWRAGAPPDLDGLAERANALKITPLAVELLRGRGIEGEGEQLKAIAPKLKDLRRPDDMAGFPAALDRLLHAQRDRLRVGVFGDYDVDGVTTATILTTYLEAIGIEVVCRVATRDTGYGLGIPDAQAFVEAGAQLVLTGDCGTSDHEALGYLKARGIATVVIDHHQVPESMPPADALINPHQPDCGFPFKGLCSAGVAFYLCAALRTRLVAAGQQPPDPRAWLDLVALGTVCDMVPLVHENRVLVRHGLRQLGGRRRPGLRALLERAGVEPTEIIDEQHVGFRLGPRINAPGRLGTAEPSLRLLRARTDPEARPLAEHIETLNARRKRHTESLVAEALAILAADPQASQRAGLVVAHTGWLPGVVGIAAAGVVEHYGRPALVLAIDPESGTARGSARSCAGVDVRAALAACASLLERFGGHREAAGATVAAANIEGLTAAFDAAVADQLADPSSAATLAQSGDVEVIDAEVGLEALTPGLVQSVLGLGPYGVGFAPPRFVLEDATVDSVRVLKEEHLALVLRQGDARHEAMAFRQGRSAKIVPGDRIGCIYAPVIDQFRGARRVRLQVERLWPQP